MESLDPDDFLADLANELRHPHRPFPAAEKLPEEEELEWLSNKDAFPALETCMLQEEPPGRGVSGSAGNGALVLQPMLNRKTNDESDKVKSMRVCAFCGVKQTLQQPGEPLAVCHVCGFSFKTGRHCSGESPIVGSVKSDRLKSGKVKSVESENVNRIIERKCTHCASTRTPQWRDGPVGPKSLCNACGLRYRTRRLCPEYRPVNSPTFSLELHSNSHRRLLKMRKQVYGTEGMMVQPVKKRTKTASAIVLEKKKKDIFPTVATVEQPSTSVIADQRSPASVLENSTNSNITVEPNQPPSKCPRQQQLLCNQPNNKPNQEDTARVVTERNSTILRLPCKAPSTKRRKKYAVKVNNEGNNPTPCGSLDPPHQAPSEVLGQQQLFSCQPTNKHRKKYTVKVNNEGNNPTPFGSLAPPHQAPTEVLGQQQLFSCQPTNKHRKKYTAIVNNEGNNATACGSLDPPHQTPSEFLEQHPHSCDQPNKMCNKQYSALEPVDICKVGLTSVLPKLSSARIADDKSKKEASLAVNTLNALEHLRSVFADQHSPVLVPENCQNSSATLMSSQSNQRVFYDQAKKKPNKDNTAKNNTSAMSCCETLKPPHQAPNKFLGQQLLLLNQPYNNFYKKDTSVVGIEVKCQNCGAEMSLQWWEIPLEPITSCHLCGLAKHTVRQKSTSLASNKKRKMEDIVNVEMAVKPGDKCTIPLMNSTKDPLLAVDTSNISKQSNVIVIAEQQGPPIVFENSTNCSMTLESSSVTVNLANQSPSEFLGQQNQFCDSGNNKLKDEDTATAELEGNSSTLMRSSGTLGLPHQTPNKVLDQQQLFCEQANNKPNREDTTRLESDGNNILMSACGTSKPAHRAQSEFLEQQQLFCDQADNETNKENTSKVESEGKCQSCGAEQSLRWLGDFGSETLCPACGSAKYTARQHRIIAVQVEKLPCPLPATGEFTKSIRTTPVFKELSLLQKPSDIANAEHQKPFSVFEKSTDDSIALMSSCGVNIPRRARSKGGRRRTIPGKQVGIGKKCMQCGKQTDRWRNDPLGPATLCNACFWERSGVESCVTVDIAKKCEKCGSEEATQWESCPPGPKTLCTACHHLSTYGRRQLCYQTNRIPCKKARTTRRECKHCGANQTPMWRPGPLGSNTLCNACGLRWYKFKDLYRNKRSKQPP